MNTNTNTSKAPAPVTVPVGAAASAPVVAAPAPPTTAGKKAEFEGVSPDHVAVLREVVASVAGPHARIVWIQPVGESTTPTHSRWVVHGRGQVMGSHNPHVRHTWK